jgi:hypothetical protein
LGCDRRGENGVVDLGRLHQCGELCRRRDDHLLGPATVVTRGRSAPGRSIPT